MSDYVRKTHVHAIYRVREFTGKRSFLEASEIELSERLDVLRRSYADFCHEHLELGKILDTDLHEGHNLYQTNIEKVYLAVAIDLRTRIQTLQEIKQRDRDAQKTCSVPSATLTSSRSNIEPQKKRECQSENQSNKKTRHVTIVTEPVESDEEVTRKVMRSVVQVKNTRDKTASTTSNHIVCHNCGRNHPMYRCERFLRLTVAERKARVRTLGNCANCLQFVGTDRDRRNHRCPAGPCKRCQRYHNSLLCEKKK